MASKIPDGVSYERAAVLPLGVSTAACGLFQKEYLGGTEVPDCASYRASRRQKDSTDLGRIDQCGE